MKCYFCDRDTRCKLLPSGHRACDSCMLVHDIGNDEEQTTVPVWQRDYLGVWHRVE